ncbi:DgyrCDS826 [Dimorphilus gyrociliatus]|uniref:DgyrCDS826 n=1 Tax=Dimorphilus gyrociliatus TaxID=2664684 RepID=A0A7I8V5P0_9ANNE|nr:DgyrCDS826 [Dimorphilus gyrociliatus]
MEKDIDYPVTENLSRLLRHLDIEIQIILINELNLKYEVIDSLDLLQKIDILTLCFDQKPEMKLNSVLQHFIYLFNFGDDFYAENFENMIKSGKLANLASYLTIEDCLEICIEEKINEKELESISKTSKRNYRLSGKYVLNLIHSWCSEHVFDNEELDSWEKTFLFVKKLANRIKQRRNLCIKLINYTFQEKDDFIKKLKRIYQLKFDELKAFSLKKTKKLLRDSYTEITWKIIKEGKYERKGEKVFVNFYELVNFVYKKKFERILMNGCSGIGKTSFAIKTLANWANGIVFNEFQIVIYINVRELRHGKTLIESFINQTFGDCTEKDEYVSLLQRITDHSKLDILYIFDEIEGLNDGLIEYLNNTLELISGHPIIVWLSKEKSKLIEETWDCVVEMNGFNDIQLINFFRKSFGTSSSDLVRHLTSSNIDNKDGKSYLEEEFRIIERQLRLEDNINDPVLKESLETIRKLSETVINPDLFQQSSSFFSACSIPLIATFYGVCWKRLESNLPNNELDLFKILLDKSIQTTLKDTKTSTTREELKVILQSIIGKIALKHIGENAIFVEKKLIEPIDSFYDNLNNLIRKVNCKESLTENFSIELKFLHSSVQEYFAAVYLTYLFEVNRSKFDNFLKGFQDINSLGKYIRVFQFIGGINFDCFKRCLDLFNQLMNEKYHQMEIKWRENELKDENRLNNLIFHYTAKCIRRFWKNIQLTYIKYISSSQLSIIFSDTDNQPTRLLEVKQECDLKLLSSEHSMISKNCEIFEIHEIFVDYQKWQNILTWKNINELKLYNCYIDDNSFELIGELLISNISSLTFHSIYANWKKLMKTANCSTARLRNLELSDVNLDADANMLISLISANLRYLSLLNFKGALSTDSNLELLSTISNKTAKLKYLKFVGFNLTKENEYEDKYCNSLQRFTSLHSLDMTDTVLKGTFENILKALCLGSRGIIEELIFSNCLIEFNDITKIHDYFKCFTGLLELHLNDNKISDTNILILIQQVVLLPSLRLFNFENMNININTIQLIEHSFQRCCSNCCLVSDIEFEENIEIDAITDIETIDIFYNKLVECYEENDEILLKSFINDFTILFIKENEVNRMIKLNIIRMFTPILQKFDSDKMLLKDILKLLKKIASRKMGRKQLKLNIALIDILKSLTAKFDDDSSFQMDLKEFICEL